MSVEADFLDTNVILYLLSGDATKADRAQALLDAGGTISVQVLNEFASVARRKAGCTWPEIGEILATVRALCRLRPLTVEVHDRARALAARTMPKSLKVRLGPLPLSRQPSSQAG